MVWSLSRELYSKCEVNEEIEPETDHKVQQQMKPILSQIQITIKTALLSFNRLEGTLLKTKLIAIRIMTEKRAS